MQLGLPMMLWRSHITVMGLRWVRGARGRDERTIGSGYARQLATLGAIDHPTPSQRGWRETEHGQQGCHEKARSRIAKHNLSS